MEEKRLAFEIVNGRSGEAESEGVNERKEAERVRVNIRTEAASKGG